MQLKLDFDLVNQIKLRLLGHVDEFPHAVPYANVFPSQKKTAINN
jgi:hypothetical protein